MIQPLGLCVVHMFNHLVRYHGQVSQRLSAAGSETAESDLVFVSSRAW